MTYQEVLYRPFLPYVVEVWHVDEWGFWAAYGTYAAAQVAANEAAQDNEFVRVVKRAESNVKS